MRSKEPVELTINIRNMAPVSKLLSVDVALDKTLCFDKNGLKKIETKRLEELAPNAIKTLKYELFPFQGIKPGYHTIKIKVNEHYQDYQHLTDMTEKVIRLRVD